MKEKNDRFDYVKIKCILTKPNQEHKYRKLPKPPKQ